MGTTFTAEQEAVADHWDGHALVSAVAGAGKTTTLVERVGRLVTNGVDPSRIMCLQFNKSAQEAFERKLRKRLITRNIAEVRTYHSLGMKMFKRLVDVGAVKPARLVTSGGKLEAQARRAAVMAWERMEGTGSYPPAEVVDALPSFITKVKSCLQPPAQVFRDGNYSTRVAVLIDAFEVFEYLSHQAQVMYFDDLIYRTMLTLQARPELWVLFNSLDQILVDEFQDTNAAQFEMVKGLATAGAHVMAVGDDDQSIYAFRGSNIDYILEIFPETFDPITRYPMTTTFRYGHETCMAAANVISRNLKRTDKFPVAAPGNPDTRIHVVQRSSRQESGLIPFARKLEQEKRLLNSAMLVRFYSQSVPYEIELLQERIPFHVYGRAPLIFIPEIAALVAGLCLTEDYWPMDEEHQLPFYEALLRTPSLFLPRERVTALAEDMMELAHSNPRQMAEPLRQAAAAATNNSLAKRLRERADLVNMLCSGALRGHPPQVTVESYLRFTKLMETIESQAVTSDAAQESRATIQAFMELVAGFATTRELLDLLGPTAADKESRPPPGDHLQILSLHRSKGLEYQVVFLPGWITGMFPRQDDEIEEDRRLAYVGITRAINNLVFLVPPDEGLMDWIRDPSALPKAGTTRVCSEFLFDADIGLCRRVASAIRATTMDSISSRDPRVATRYLEACGVKGVALTEVAGAATVMAMKPLTSQSTIKVGMRVHKEDRGYCVVHRFLYGPTYLLCSEVDGSIFPEILANNGWFSTPS